MFDKHFFEFFIEKVLGMIKESTNQPINNRLELLLSFCNMLYVAYVAKLEDKTYVVMRCKTSSTEHFIPIVETDKDIYLYEKMPLYKRTPIEATSVYGVVEDCQCVLTFFNQDQKKYYGVFKKDGKLYYTKDIYHKDAKLTVSVETWMLIEKNFLITIGDLTYSKLKDVDFDLEFVSKSISTDFFTT